MKPGAAHKIHKIAGDILDVIGAVALGFLSSYLLSLVLVLNRSKVTTLSLGLSGLFLILRDYNGGKLSFRSLWGVEIRCCKSGRFLTLGQILVKNYAGLMGILWAVCLMNVPIHSRGCCMYAYHMVTLFPLWIVLQILSPIVFLFFLVSAILYFFGQRSLMEILLKIEYVEGQKRPLPSIGAVLVVLYLGFVPAFLLGLRMSVTQSNRFRRTYPWSVDRCNFSAVKIEDRIREYNQTVEPERLPKDISSLRSYFVQSPFGRAIAVEPEVTICKGIRGRRISRRVTESLQEAPFKRVNECFLEDRIIPVSTKLFAESQGNEQYSFFVTDEGKVYCKNHGRFGEAPIEKAIDQHWF